MVLNDLTIVDNLADYVMHYATLQGRRDGLCCHRLPNKSTSHHPSTLRFKAPRKSDLMSYSTVVTSPWFTARVFYYDLIIVRYFSRCWEQVKVLVKLRVLIGVIRPIGLSRATKFIISYSPGTLLEASIIYTYTCIDASDAPHIAT